MRNVFIYTLCEPGTRTVRYIGKTINPKGRLNAHLKVSSKQKNHLGNWLRSLSELPNMIMLCEVPEEEGSAMEIKYISAARVSLGMKLVNGTDGGEGCLNPTSEHRAAIGAASRNRKRTAETLEKLRAAWTPQRRAVERATKIGTHLSLEIRAKQSASWTPERKEKERLAMSGENNPNFGKHMSEEQKQKLRASWTAERRAKQSAWNTASKAGVPQSAEANAKRKATCTGQKRSPEACANMRVAWLKRREKSNK